MPVRSLKALRKAPSTPDFDCENVSESMPRIEQVNVLMPQTSNKKKGRSNVTVLVIVKSFR